jgi:hypothetical protein
LKCGYENMRVKPALMKKPIETFESLIRYKYDLRTVFDDFLTMTICALSQNLLTGKSHDEDLYMLTVEMYKNDEQRHRFPKMLGTRFPEEL